MVNSAVWPDTPQEVKEKLRGPGYRGIGRDIFVPEENAFCYALEQCAKNHFTLLGYINWTEEFEKMLVEWFYSSGDWIKEG